MKYRNIIFLQNSQDFDDFHSNKGFGSGVEGFFNSHESEMIEYLSQWDYGEGEEMNDCGAGSNDDIYNEGNYQLSYNSRLGYAGLCEVLKV